MTSTKQHVQLSGARELQGPTDGARQARYDAGENDDGDAVTHTAFTDLLAQPHEEHGTGHQRRHGGNPKAQARIDDHRQRSGLLTLQRDGNTQRLKARQKHRAVARIARDLAPPCLAFLAQLLQARLHVGEQLHDDGCGDVRHDADGEYREAPERAAGEHVEHVENGAALLIEQQAPAPPGRYPAPG